MCRFQDLVLNTLDKYSRCVVTVTLLYQYSFLYLPLLFSVPKIKRLLANQNCLAVTVIVGSKPVTEIVLGSKPVTVIVLGSKPVTVIVLGSKPVTIIVCGKPVASTFANWDITLLPRPDQGGVGQSPGNSLTLLSHKNVKTNHCDWGLAGSAS